MRHRILYMMAAVLGFTLGTSSLAVAKRCAPGQTIRAGQCVTAKTARKGKRAVQQRPMSKSYAYKRLRGAWALDMSAFEKMPEFQAIPAHQRKTALDMLKEKVKLRMFFGKKTLTVNFRMNGKKNRTALPYRVVDARGKTITIETDKDGDTERQALKVSRYHLSVKLGDRTWILRRLK